MRERFTARRGSRIQGSRGFDECSKVSRVKFFSNFHQLLLISRDDEESIFCSLIGCAFGVRGNGDLFLKLLIDQLARGYEIREHLAVKSQADHFD